MLLTPAAFICHEKLISPRFGRRDDRQADAIDEPGTAIIAGIGRFGQIVNRMLTTNGHTTVVLDYDADMIELVRRFGIRSYFGDATRPDLLHSAGAEDATLLVAALDDRPVRLLKISASRSAGLESGEPRELLELGELQPEEVFRQCYRQHHEEDPPPQLAAAFHELVEQVEEEER